MRVADFGLAKLAPTLSEGETHIATRLMGTVGYIDPEYAQSGRLDESSDGYSVGTVILQLLTGIPAHDPDASVPNLAYRMRKDLRPDRADGIADKSAGKWPDGVAAALATAAAGLLRQRRPDRMALRDALQLLQLAWDELSQLERSQSTSGADGLGGIDDEGGAEGGGSLDEGDEEVEDGSDTVGAEQHHSHLVARSSSRSGAGRSSPGLKRSVSVPHRLHRHTYSVDSTDSIDSLLVATEVEEATTFNTFQAG